jgi:NTE family protein
VFGPTRIPCDGLRAAIAASCAVPGYFAPVEVDGVLYLDGGIASPTNADVLRDQKFDLVIAVSPMSTSAGHAGHGLERLVRRHAHRKLRTELAALAADTPKLVLEPGRNAIEYLPADFMSDASASEIVRAAFTETVATVDASPLRDRLPRARGRAA